MRLLDQICIFQDCAAILKVERLKECKSNVLVQWTKACQRRSYGRPSPIGCFLVVIIRLHGAMGVLLFFILKAVRTKLTHASIESRLISSMIFYFRKMIQTMT
nr:hypothetical protein Iba_chr09fCG10350 [Ipomoea batatas]